MSRDFTCPRTNLDMVSLACRNSLCGVNRSTDTMRGIAVFSVPGVV
jgi:hypothetical protein